VNPEYRQYCEDMLPQVSRTFALGISLLRDPLNIQIGVGYLICRILDSVEDTNAVEVNIRYSLLQKMATQLCQPARASLLSEIQAAFPLSQFTGPEYELLHNIHQVMGIFDAFPKEVQESIQTCALEMGQGMAKTVEREHNHQLPGLKDAADLEQYCYYVAGTVGRLLTKLFAHDRSSITPKVKQSLMEKEVAFGLGLQMTNILKGIFEDHARGVVYVPQNMMQKHGLNFDNILAPEKQQEGRGLVMDMIALILPYMDKAIEYTLLIPTTESDIRLFCALPVLFALRTLRLAKEHPESVLTAEPLKIKRKEVKELHLEADRCIMENDRLARLFSRERSVELF